VVQGTRVKSRRREYAESRAQRPRDVGRRQKAISIIEGPDLESLISEKCENRILKIIENS